MTNVTKTANEYFLTQAQFDARKQAGTLEVGAVYHITDAHSGAVLYRHTIKFTSTVEEDAEYFVVVVDNYNQAYTSESIMNKYGHCTFVGHEDKDGPPGGVAIITNSFTALPPVHFDAWYAMVKNYGESVQDYLIQVNYVSDTVTTF